MKKIPIPNFIKKEIQKHILDRCPHAEEGWENTLEEEDAITGDFFGNLRTSWNSSNNYKWRFGYDKVRGRGPGAIEKSSGTDGIITITFTDKTTGDIYYKSMVFQAKKINGTINELQKQKMERHFPNCNVILTYGPSGYFAKDENNNTTRMCELIANDFLNCKIGVFGLRYNRAKKRFADDADLIIHSLHHEVKIDIEKVWER